MINAMEVNINGRYNWKETQAYVKVVNIADSSEIYLRTYRTL